MPDSPEVQAFARLRGLPLSRFALKGTGLEHKIRDKGRHGANLQPAALAAFDDLEMGPAHGRFHHAPRALGLVWWLMAAAIGPEAYATFVSCATSPIGYLVMIGLSWFFFQHLCSGLRHFVLDMGAGYELRTNKSWSIGVFLAGAALTILFWAYIFFGKAF